MPDFSALSVYFGVFFALIAAGVGFPVPEELPIVTAGAVLGHAANDPDNPLRWYVLLPLCILGVVLSDLLLYGLGRTFGVRLLQFRLVARVLPAEKLARIEERFQRHGVVILLLARFTPGIRSPIFIAAGIMRLPWKRFLLADGLYAIPGVTLLFFLAYWFTDRFRDWVIQAENYVAGARVVLIAAAVVCAGVYLPLRYWHGPRRAAD